MAKRPTALPFRLSSVLGFLLAASGCATFPAAPSADAPSRGPSAETREGLSPTSLQAIREIEKEILDADAELEKAEDGVGRSRTSRIPIEINENVMKWIHYFTVTDRERFHRFLQRGSAYKPLVQKILKENGVPTELYYLAMIESGYVTHARSSASAVGIWQFIRGTGLRYGLRQNRYVDERRDVVRATESAAKYLRNLHTAFQSWYLAMAGYNAGEGRILGAIMRGGSRDFWDLVEKKALPPETRNYVPKFLAAAIIGRNPAKYGFHDIHQPALPEREALKSPGGLSLAAISQATAIPLAELKTLNPQLLRSMTPPGRDPYPVWIPQGAVTDLNAAQARLATLRVVKPRSAKRVLASGRGARVKSFVYKVRRGDALTRIAARYGVPVRKIKKLNGLRSNRIHAGQKLKIARKL